MDSRIQASETSACPSHLPRFKHSNPNRAISRGVSVNPQPPVEFPFGSWTHPFTFAPNSSSNPKSSIA
ncbi:hypothetical protein D1872_335370 [compost metagenome]